MSEWINDAQDKYSVTIGTRRNIYPIYNYWISMRDRVLLDRNNWYSECYVCDSWKTYSNFEKWASSRPHKNMELDKDILIKNNKVYSPEACEFVPNYINCCILLPRYKKELPRGVTYHKASGKYFAQCKIAHKQKKYGKYYNNPLDAHKEWQKFKIEGIESAIFRWKTSGEFYPEFHNKVVDALEERVYDILEDIYDDKETEYL